MAINGDIARETFDAVAAIDRVGNLQELETTALLRFRDLGVDIVAAGVARPPDQGGLSLLFGNLEHDWARHYEACWKDRCPIVSEAISRTGPVFWTDVRQADPDPAARDLLQEAGEFGMKDGHVTVLSRGPSESLLVATAASQGLDAPGVRLATHLLSLHFALVGFGLQGDRSVTATARPDLTPRQLECLRWVRDGKSAWEIGAILGLSARTVEDHLNKACIRLGVHTRMQAVVEAARLDLISL